MSLLKLFETLKSRGYQISISLVSTKNIEIKRTICINDNIFFNKSAGTNN